MKKIFTTIALAAVCGFAFADDTDITIDFTGVENAWELVTVSQINNAAEPTSTPVEWENVEPSNTVDITTNGFTYFVINVEEGYYLTATWEPIQSHVTITEVTPQVVENLEDKGAKVNGLFVVTKTGNYGYILDGTVVTVTVHEGTNEGQEETYEPIPVKFDIPADASDLIQSLTFLGETTTFSENEVPTDYTVTFNRNIDYDAVLSIGFRTDADGNFVYNVGNVEAAYVNGETGLLETANANSSAGGASVVIPINATEVVVAFTVTDADKDYIEYTINVNIPNGIIVLTNEEDEDRNPIAVEITEESNVIQASTYDVISIHPAEDFAILSVTNGLGLPISGYDNRIDLKDGMVINIEVQDNAGVEFIKAAPNEKLNIYNLQGVRVDENNLQKGIYIINGKKVLVK